MNTVFCPTHHEPLKIEEEAFDLLGKTALVGRCPKCKCAYISRNLLPNASVLNIAGVRYQFLQELHDYEETEKKNREQKQRREILRQQKLQKEAEEYKKIALEEKKRKKQQRQEKQRRQLIEKQNKNKERREAIESNPDLEVSANWVNYYIHQPAVCPHDHWALVAANRIKWRGKKEAGLYCTKCGRAYFPIESAKKTKKKVTSGNNAHDTHESRNNSFIPNALRNLGDVPQSIVLAAVIHPVLQDDSKSADRIVMIVGEQKEQDSSNGIYWIGRLYPSLILAAILTNPNRQFVLQNIKYNVSEYRTFQNTRKYLNVFSRFYNPTAPQSVYVFSHKNIAAFSGARYESVTAMVPCANATYPVPISVYYEKSTHKYFINETSYQAARLQYGLPYLRVQIDASHDTYGQFGSNLNAQSQLFLLGYSVRESGGMSLQQRQKLLSDIINSGIMTKAEVMNHIEWLIHIWSGISRMENAVGEWRADLAYVSRLGVNKERTILVKNFLRG